MSVLKRKHLKNTDLQRKNMTNFDLFMERASCNALGLHRETINFFLPLFTLSFCLFSPLPEAVWRESESRRATKHCSKTPCCGSPASTRRTARTSMSPVRCLLKENLSPCPFAPRTKRSAHVGSEYRTVSFYVFPLRSWRSFYLLDLFVHMTFSLNFEAGMQ